MIEGLKPYAEYKESGLEWLGQVPRQWASFPLCRVATPKSECGRTDLELLSVYLHRGVIRYADSGGQVHKPSLDLSKYQVVAPGDFVLNNQQAWRGSIGVSKFQGIISPAYVVLKLSQKLNSDYANYLFRSPAMVAQYVAASRGVGDIQRNLFYPDLRNSIAIVPPPDEQAAIVRFLDHANRKIDGFIRAKRKLIGLLNEQKQAIIHRAVTRGLHPDAPLKPSGIPWLGDIPSHWNIVPGMMGLREKQVKNIGMREKRVLSLSYGRIVIKPEEKLYGLVPESFETYQIVSPGDIIIRPTDLQNDHTSLRVGLVKDRGIITCAYICLQTLLPFEIEYAYQLLNSYDFQKVFYGLGSGTRQNLSFSDFKRLPLPLAPRVEQLAIVEFISQQNAAILPVIARTEREIALMQEYRKRLTADLVMGKLDVREAAAKLPATIDEGNAKESSNEISEESEEEILES